MKQLTTKGFDEISLWVYRNGREIELALWQYAFENGSKEAVLSALSIYQNQDGGFGNALEPDSWNPNSSPYTTLYAINLLDEIDFCDVHHPIFKGIFKFLESGTHLDENGWLFNIPSNDDFPHAPWWTYSPEANKFESGGVTMGICGFILKYAHKDLPLYKKAFSLTEKTFAELNKVDDYGEMGVGGLLSIKEMIVKLNLENKFNMDFISSPIKKLVNEAIERDVNKWAYHCKRPSDFITSPESEFYADNEDIMQKELDWILDSRLKSSVWGIDWSWFDNNEKYPKEFAISENWWKANNARGTVKLLQSFARLEIE